MGLNHIDLPPAPASVGRARRFCAGALTDQGADGGLVDTATLLVSELVTNAVLHAGTGCAVTVDVDDPVRVEVTDAADDLPGEPPVEADGDSGRGLSLVRSLADGFGTERLAAGKRIWFELSWR